MTSSRFFRIALQSAVSAYLVFFGDGRWFTSAPAAISLRTHSTCPYRLAACKGASSAISVTFGSAFAASKASKCSIRPSRAEMKSAVRPSPSEWLMSSALANKTLNLAIP